uniref:Uncharacterized protein n=1 Tax=Rhodnius prolixus TaxID=13249 RepID=T1HHY9_RHOPR
MAARMVASAVLGAATGTGLALLVAMTLVLYRYYASRRCLMSRQSHAAQFRIPNHLKEDLWSSFRHDFSHIETQKELYALYGAENSGRFIKAKTIGMGRPHCKNAEQTAAWYRHRYGKDWGDVERFGVPQGWNVNRGVGRRRAAANNGQQQGLAVTTQKVK